MTEAERALLRKAAETCDTGAANLDYLLALSMRRKVDRVARRIAERRAKLWRVAKDLRAIAELGAW